MEINDLIGGMLGGPTPEEKARALNMGLLTAGLGLLGRRNIGDAGLLGMQAGQGALEKSMAERKANLQNAALLMKLKKDMEQQEALKGFASTYMTPGGAALAEGAKVGDIGPTVTNAARIGAPAQSVPPFGALAVNAPPEVVKLMMADWELRNPKELRLPKVEVTAGDYAFNPYQTKPGFLPSAKVDEKGNATLKQIVDGLPLISNIPGSLQARREQIINEETARQPFSTMRLPTKAGSETVLPTDIGMQVLRQRQQGEPQATPQPPIGLPLPVPRQSAKSILEGELAAEQSKLATEKDPIARQRTINNIEMIRKELAGQPGFVTSPQPSSVDEIGRTPTDAERIITKTIETASIEKAQLDAKRAGEFEVKIPQLSSTLRRLDRMEELARDDKVFNAAGAEIKMQLGSIAQAFGLPLNKEKTANTELYIANVAELLKERLSSKDYGSGTGISNVDLIAAGRPLPEVMRTKEGKLKIIQALKADATRALNDSQALRDYFNQNKGLSGFKFPSEANRSREDILRQYGVR